MELTKRITLKISAEEVARLVQDAFSDEFPDESYDVTGADGFEDLELEWEE